MLATVYAIPDVLVFAAATLLILIGALGVITMKNPVHSALSLILALMGVAVAFLEQNADFLAAVEVIVYAGAIVVLVLFVSMFLGVDSSGHPQVEPLVGQRWLAALGVVVTVAGVITLMVNSHWVSGVMSASTGGTPMATGSDGVTQLGQSVFTTYLLAFEATAGLLIIAVVGAVLLARRERPADEELELGDLVEDDAAELDDEITEEVEQ